MRQANTSYVYLCGDFNSRTGILEDFIEPDNWETNNPISHSVFPDTHKGSNVDKIVNTYGRKLNALCKATGLQILHGRVTESKFICFTHNRASTIEHLADISKSTVLDCNCDSDHCALTFNFHKHIPKTDPRSDARKIFPMHYVRDEQQNGLHRRMLWDELSREMQAELFCDIIKNNIDSKELVGRCNACLDYVMKGIFKQKINQRKNNTFPVNEWYDEECTEHKSRLRHLSFISTPLVPPSTINPGPWKNSTGHWHKRKNDQVEIRLNNPTEQWNFWKKNNLKYHITDHLNAEMFRDHYVTTDFSDTCGHDQSLMQNITEFIDSDHNVFDIMSNEVLWDILNDPINEEELWKALGKLKK